MDITLTGIAVHPLILGTRLDTLIDNIDVKNERITLSVPVTQGGSIMVLIERDNTFPAYVWNVRTLVSDQSSTASKELEAIRTVRHKMEGK